MPCLQQMNELIITHITSIPWRYNKIFVDSSNTYTQYTHHVCLSKPYSRQKNFLHYYIGE
jgi:hypothetical protein